MVKDAELIFFGLDDVGLGLITFFAIFIITGVMSYKFGINSPAAIMAFIFSKINLLISMS